MKEIEDRLFALQEPAYADFQAKLTPTVPRERMIGVRVPLLRKIAAEYDKKPREREAFLRELPHRYYEEDMLHGLMIGRIRDPGACLEEAERFLPYVDNWAVCDSMTLPNAVKEKAFLRERAERWAASAAPFTCRFGLNVLMRYFLEEDFDPSFLRLAADVRSEEYYVRMMVAFYFATALAKQWDAALPYLTDRRLDDWTHRKTIQKACESYRVSDEQKRFLRTLK